MPTKEHDEIAIKLAEAGIAVLEAFAGFLSALERMAKAQADQIDRLAQKRNNWVNFAGGEPATRGEEA